MTPCSPCLRGEPEMISQMRHGLRAKPALGFFCVFLWLTLSLVHTSSGPYGLRLTKSRPLQESFVARVVCGWIWPRLLITGYPTRNLIRRYTPTPLRQC